jgi:DNA polymerase IV
MKRESIFFHVDMDAFYAAVEQSDKPEVKGKPVIIGAAPGRRGVVSACSYEARAYGIHSAMPISEAFRRCPHGAFLPVRMERYQEVSRIIMSLFSQFTPEIKQISVDEAFLDMTGTGRLFGPPEKAASDIKKLIKETTGLTISIGIAPNRFLAKLASEVDKPDGLFRVKAGEEEQFLDSLELKSLWGLGKKTLQRLHELNIRSIKDLRSCNMQLLKRMMGDASGEFLYNACRGIDPGIFRDEVKTKSISNETTFGRDIRDREAVRITLLELSHQVMFRMMAEGERGSTVFIKVRFSDFRTTTAQKTLSKAVSSAEELLSVAEQLLSQRWNGSDEIRLIGLGVSGLEATQKEQGELFEDQWDRKKQVEETVLKLRSRGNRMVKASLLKSDRSPDGGRENH